MQTTTSLEPRKSIEYDRQSKDYAYKFDDQVIGFESTYHSAEVALNEYVHTLLMDGTLAEPQTA